MRPGPWAPGSGQRPRQHSGQEGFGLAGSNVGIGAGILCRTALTHEFADAGGKYFDNDAGRFVPPHPDALDVGKDEAVVKVMETEIAKLAG